MRWLTYVAPIMVVLTGKMALAQTPPAQAAPLGPPPLYSGQAAPQPRQPGDAFGLQIVLPARTMIYITGKSGWANAYDALRNSIGRLRAYADKQNMAASGPALVIYTNIGDQGFSFRAALPMMAAPAQSPPAGIEVGAAPSGRAFKFVHRGSYDAMESTYEAITEFLDEQNLDATEPFIEEYVSDPLPSKADNLIVNVYVPVK